VVVLRQDAILNGDLRPGDRIIETIELFAIESVAKNISQSQLKSIRKLMERMNVAAQEGDVKAFVDYDVRVHEAIIYGCGNEMINKLWHLANVSL